MLLPTTENDFKKRIRKKNEYVKKMNAKKEKSSGLKMIDRPFGPVKGQKKKTEETNSSA